MIRYTFVSVSNGVCFHLFVLEGLSAMVALFYLKFSPLFTASYKVF